MGDDAEAAPAAAAPDEVEMPEEPQAPAAEDAAAPAADEDAAAPGADEDAAAPGAEDAAVPAADEDAAAPAEEDAAMPAAEDAAAPAAEASAAPAAEDTVEPAAEDGAAPAAEDSATPVAEDTVEPAAEDTVEPAAREGAATEEGGEAEAGGSHEGEVAPSNDGADDAGTSEVAPAETAQGAAMPAGAGREGAVEGAEGDASAEGEGGSGAGAAATAEDAAPTADEGAAGADAGAPAPAASAGDGAAAAVENAEAGEGAAVLESAAGAEEAENTTEEGNAAAGEGESAGGAQGAAATAEDGAGAEGATATGDSPGGVVGDEDAKDGADAATLDAGGTEALVGGSDGSNRSEIEGCDEDDEAIAAEQHTALDDLDEEAVVFDAEADDLTLAETAVSELENRERELRGINAALQRRVAAALQSRSPSGRAIGGGAAAERGARGGGGGGINSPDRDATTRYSSGLQMWIDAKEELGTAQEDATAFEADLRARLVEREETSARAAESFRALKMEVARAAEDSRTGKGIPERTLRSFELQDAEKEQEVQRVRLKNIQLRAQLRKLEGALRQKEELVDGLHLIDFEQLKIENQSLAEKIVERNEELLKLRKKTTSTVQVLTHKKEKLQFVQRESEVLARALERLEKELAGKRDELQRAKRRRDKLRTDNAMLRAQNGKVTSVALLNDMDVQSGKRDELLVSLKQKRREQAAAARSLANAQGDYEARAAQVDAVANAGRATNAGMRAGFSP